MSTLGEGGKALWESITEDHELDAGQLVQLEEACRIKDRCDALDRAVRLLESEGDLKDYLSAVAQANASANQMKQLLAALRLPDPQTGKRPQYRGPRGAQKPTVPGGAKVSSIERARQRSQTG
jgi:hypothetical protein